MPELSAFRCNSCGRTTFPRHARCPTCKNVDFAEVPMETGTVITFTRLTATRPGFPRPLTIAVVEFQDRVRVLGQLDDEAPRTGMKVTVSHGELGAGQSGFKFVHLHR